MARARRLLAAVLTAAKKHLFAFIIPAVIVILHLGFASAVLAPLQARFGSHAAYLIHFFYGFVPAVLVLSVKHLAELVRMDHKPEKKGLAYASWLFLRELLARGLIFYSAWEHRQKLKFAEGWRASLKRYGAPIAAVVVAIPAAPWGAAILMRVWAVPESRAWIYVAIASAANTAVVAYGGLPAIKAMFG